MLKEVTATKTLSDIISKDLKNEDSNLLAWQVYTHIQALGIVDDQVKIVIKKNEMRQSVTGPKIKIETSILQRLSFLSKKGSGTYTQSMRVLNKYFLLKYLFLVDEIIYY
jgi:hypothetical protein